MAGRQIERARGRGREGKRVLDRAKSRGRKCVIECERERERRSRASAAAVDAYKVIEINEKQF